MSFPFRLSSIQEKGLYDDIMQKLESATNTAVATDDDASGKWLTKEAEKIWHFAVLWHNSASKG